MPALISLVGKRFGKLRVISRGGIHAGQVQWLCECDCGRKKVLQGGNLKNGVSRSCGCLQRESAEARFKTHGASKTRPYKAWQGMIARCTNPKHRSFKDYGGRGIKVCDRWLKFENFLADMGERPVGMTLDRYPNGAGNYEPDNCRWASSIDQARNRRPRGHVKAAGKQDLQFEAVAA